VVQALLIIDMQTALVPHLWRGEELADRIALLAQRARSQGAPVVAIQQLDQHVPLSTRPIPVGS